MNLRAFSSAVPLLLCALAIACGLPDPSGPEELTGMVHQEISVPSGNLLPNPSFESSLSGWNAWQGSLSRVMVGDSLGGYAARLAWSSGGHYSMNDLTARTTSAGTYRATAWVRAATSNAVGKPVQIVIRQRNSAGAQVAWMASTALSLTTSFQEVAVSAAAVAGNRLDLYVIQARAASGDALLVDAMGLTFTVDSPVSDAWELLYEDHFIGTTLNTSTVDLSRKVSGWSPYYSAGHAGNGLRRPEAFSLDGNGNLVITAKMSSTGDIVSGGMSNKTSLLYGRYEARVRTEVDSTGTMSGVILTWPISGGNLANGENDFYETGHAASGRNPFYSYIHWPGASWGGEQTRFVHYADATQWHDMAMEWTPETIKVFRDGVLIGTLHESADPNRDNIPDIAHRLCLQLDAFSDTTVLSQPVRMYVDYVRVYKKR